MDFIERHPDWKWDIWGILRNPSTKLKFIKEHFSKSHNIHGLCGNKNLTFDFIEHNPDWAWEIYTLSANPFTKELCNERNELFLHSLNTPKHPFSSSVLYDRNLLSVIFQF